MPTERFLRLPKEKIEAIRIAAAKEFIRVPLEEASINRIVHDANIDMLFHTRPDAATRGLTRVQLPAN